MLYLLLIERKNKEKEETSRDVQTHPIGCG
jgi:hypothetical protein